MHKVYKIHSYTLCSVVHQTLCTKYTATHCAIHQTPNTVNSAAHCLALSCHKSGSPQALYTFICTPTTTSNLPSLFMHLQSASPYISIYLYTSVYFCMHSFSFHFSLCICTPTTSLCIHSVPLYHTYVHP